MRIDFWLTRTGAYLSHSKGLTVEEVQQLRQLSPGDQLVIYTNDTSENPARAALSLKLSKDFKSNARPAQE